NLQAVLDLMATGRLDLSPLISHRFPIERAEAAYEIIEKGSEPFLGIVLTYPVDTNREGRRSIDLRSAQRKGKLNVGGPGAGDYGGMGLLPALGRCTNLHAAVLCSAGGVSAAHSGAKLGFASATTDENAVLADPAIDAVFSITRHDQHARHVIEAIRQRKSI